MITLHFRPSQSHRFSHQNAWLTPHLKNNLISFFFQRVDYDGIRRSSEFARYKELTRELVRVRIAEASREEKLAFFVNVYNAMVIHGNIERGPPVSTWQRYKVY